MKPSLAGVDLRLAHADEHLAVLHGYRELLLNDNAGRILGHFEPQTRDYIFRVAAYPPDEFLGVIVGEFAHALRSALDNALWQVILARLGTPTGQTGFPIFEQETNIQGQSNIKRARRMTAGVSRDDWTFIESLQPYHSRSHPSIEEMDPPQRAKLRDRHAAWHPLALLGYLNNVDKHRYIHVAYAAAAFEVPDRSGRLGPALLGPGGRVDLFLPVNQVIQIRGASVFPRWSGTKEFVTGYGEFSFRGSDDDRTEIARLVRLPDSAGSDPQVEMYPSPFIEIAFSDRERPMSIMDLDDIRGTVREVIDHFRPIFAEPKEGPG